ncbi:isocitrate lyase/PEP mutase family protein [Nonomuraea africana]|uniref:2-methylisocitrate lyase-like PEP mutase family enzyme n=1 Tax=Nonomuraea africana TaxID=46171 RepID=A0ABR9KWP7_9ACTN|nr:isocitrate lyase/phosphoenolpyruvate mutase family protein [Nonomuraea africana]MBE1566450.1 2-methylisocitrate lyase-like PEP mutase family enzyme [Nonomuraea africana]
MTFHDLHKPGEPLLLPNAWDYGSAALLAARGYPAIGTTSLGVAAVHGKPDAAAATRAETLDLVLLVKDLPAYLTVDIENGFSDDPAAVAELVDLLAGLGVAGINLEDGRADGTLRPIAEQTRILRAVTGRGVFVNARTDAHWLGTGDSATERIRAYADAGADGVFVPGVADLAAIAELAKATELPLNVLYSHGVAELAGVGVARISTGSLLYRAALQGALAVLEKDPALPTYEEIVGLLPDPR